MADIAPAAVSQPAKLKVFISYSRRDALDFAHQLKAALEAFGYEPLLDVSGISGGEDWRRRLGALILEADTVIFLLTPESAQSDICAWEVDEALRLGKRLFPLAALPLASVTPPEALRQRNYIHFYAEPSVPGAGFGQGLQRLVAALSTDLDWVREHTRLTTQAERWRAQHGSDDALLFGKAIDEAEDWLRRRPRNAPEPPSTVVDLIRASRASADDRLRRERAQLAEMRAAQEAREAAVKQAEAALADKEVERVAREAAQQRATELARQEASQARKVARRTMTGLIAALVLSGLAGGAGLYAYRQQQEAVAGRREAEVQRQEAQRNFAAAKQAVDGLTLDIAEGLRSVEGMRIATITRILDLVRAVVNRLAETAPDNPELLQSRATMLTVIGDTLSAKGDGDAAGKSYEEALAIEERLADRDPNNPVWQSEIGTILSQIGYNMRSRGDVPGSIKPTSRSLDIRRDLARRYPDNPGFQVSLAIEYQAIGKILESQVKHAEAMESYGKAVAINEALLKADPTNAFLKDGLARALVSSGSALRSHGENDQALAAFKRVQMLYEELVASDHSNVSYQSQLAGNLSQVGDLQFMQGDAPAYLKAIERKLEIFQHLTMTDPENAEWQDGLGTSFRELGDIIVEQNKVPPSELSRALDIFKQCAERAELAVKLDPLNANRQFRLGVCYQRISNTRKAQGDNAGAFDAAKKNHAIALDNASRHPDDAAVQHALAQSFARMQDWWLSQGDTAAALSAAHSVLEIRQRMATQLPDVQEVRIHLSEAHEHLADILKANDDAAALEEYEQSLKILRELAVTYHADRATVQKEMLGVAFFAAQIHQKQGDHDAAAAAYKESLAAAVNLIDFKPDDDTEKFEQQTAIEFGAGTLSEITNKIAEIDLQQRKPLEAIEYVDKCVGTLERLDRKSDLAAALGNRSWYLLFVSRFADAEADMRRALMLDPEIKWGEDNLALALMFQNKTADAEKILLGNRGRTIQDRTWEEIILDDFRQLRAIGITHPDLDRIESLLRTPR